MIITTFTNADINFEYIGPVATISSKAIIGRLYTSDSILFIHIEENLQLENSLLKRIEKTNK